jgi:hypothetical protein
MKTMKRTILISVILLFTALVSHAQARLTIENNSKRLMTIKVMNGNGSYNSLHKTVTIVAYSSETIYFSTSGQYFTKSKAVLSGRDPVYQKGKPFQVTNDETGYSVMTLTFSITESAVPQVSGGIQISKTEFDKN